MTAQPNNTNRRKVKKGVVYSNKMDKTVVVEVTRTMRHPRYHKIIKRRKRYYAHDESNALQIGQEVVIKETRPLSKLKRWCVVQNKNQEA